MNQQGPLTAGTGCCRRRTTRCFIWSTRWSATRAMRVHASTLSCSAATPRLSSKQLPAGYSMQWLDRISLSLLLPVALLLALAPFVPEPHLWEKLKMLFAGTLSRPIDIFDLALHGGPLVLLVLKLIRMRSQR